MFGFQCMLTSLTVFLSEVFEVIDGEISVTPFDRYLGVKTSHSIHTIWPHQCDLTPDTRKTNPILVERGSQAQVSSMPSAPPGIIPGMIYFPWLHQPHVINDCTKQHSRPRIVYWCKNTCADQPPGLTRRNNYVKTITPENELVNYDISLYEYQLCPFIRVPIFTFGVQFSIKACNRTVYAEWAIRAMRSVRDASTDTPH